MSQNDNSKKKFTPNNIEIFDYFEQDESFKRILLGQIKSPSRKGAKHLCRNIKDGVDQGKLFIMYGRGNNHIISFGTSIDFDEIKTDELKLFEEAIRKYSFTTLRNSIIKSNKS